MTQVTAPFSGRILSVKVEVGDSVKRDQELFVIESLKMPNSIVASEDGTIVKVNVREGDDIDTGDVVMRIA